MNKCLSISALPPIRGSEFDNEGERNSQDNSVVFDLP